MTAQVRESKSRSRLKAPSLKVNRQVFALSRVELIAVTLAVAAVGLVLSYYFMSLRPVQQQLSATESALETQKKAMMADATSGKASPQQMIKQAKESLVQFQEHSLQPFSQGRIDVINEINELVKNNNLHLTSGIMLHSVTNEGDLNIGKPQSKRKGNDALDVFPRVQMTFAVVGQYPELRKFIKELQNSKHFMVVDTLSLTPVEQKSGRGGRGQQAVPVSGISLNVMMNVYFRPQPAA